jgi:hypothetical protein
VAEATDVNDCQSGQVPGQIKHNRYASQYLVFFYGQGRRFGWVNTVGLPADRVWGREKITFSVVLAWCVRVL